MLANILAVLLASGSFIFYVAAFFYPEVHRRSDIVWSGLGLLYAATLWFGSGQMTGIVLLGQMIAIALVLALGWQTLSTRREKTPVYQQTPVVITPEVVGTWAKNQINQLRIAPPDPVPVKLEKRRLSEFSADRIDPRRRPAYEYEFVEDGIVDQFPQSPVLEPQALALDLPSTNSATTTDFEYTAPPSAEAEVLFVESPQSEVTEAEPAEALGSPESEVELAASQAETSEIEVSEAASSEMEVAEVMPSEVTLSKVTPSETEVSEAKPSEVTPSEVEAFSEEDDWGETAWTDLTPVDSPSNNSASKQKPSLLAMPLILVGWMKDVVTSFTRPKPSKPVIVIPRRETATTLDNRLADKRLEREPNISDDSDMSKDRAEDAIANSEAPWNHESHEAPEAPAEAPAEALEKAPAEVLEESNWDD